METRRHSSRASATFGMLMLLTTAACSKSKSAPEANEQSVASADNEPSPASIELRDETPNLLLTWIDEQGDFHVVQTIAEVPEPARAQVRVVVTTRELGTGKTVLVADLRTKDDRGTYPVVTMDRAQWNELGAAKRQVRMEAMAPKTPALDTSASSTASAADVAPGKVKAVIYGASWCKPCHDAEALLKKLGVDVVKKDIEESRAAQAEMQQKLTKAGRGGASIPVIDVNGQLFVGFEPRTLTAAVERARKGSGIDKL